VLEVEVTVAPVGASKDTGALTAAAHLITPESEARSHYFWRLARNFAIEDEDLSARMTAAVDGAFATEDKPMIEAQQRYMRGQEFDQLSPVLLQSDGAAMRARRILAAKIETEKSTAPS
jgi:phenylpropionate dioxygenase-like ring-hydroxylating dioxygenase large terminal subunit